MTTATISSIVGPLTDAIEAESNFNSANRLHWQARMSNLDTTATTADLCAAHAAVNRAFTALADAIANAPECRVKEAILSGAWSSMQATIARDAA